MGAKPPNRVTRDRVPVLLGMFSSPDLRCQSHGRFLDRFLVYATVLEQIKYDIETTGDEKVSFFLNEIVTRLDASPKAPELEGSFLPKKHALEMNKLY